ncbi:MAG: hypothetical protein L0Y56_05500, partial [Nitrospira sp.]|nr:hypothetical protein [Nitrospira sp.]
MAHISVPHKLMFPDVMTGFRSGRKYVRIVTDCMAATIPDNGIYKKVSNDQIDFLKNHIGKSSFTFSCSDSNLLSAGTKFWLPTGPHWHCFNNANYYYYVTG